MNGILALLIKGIPGTLAKGLVGLMGPTIRGLKLEPGELDTLLHYVAALTRGETVTYAPLHAYTVGDVQDLCEFLRETVVFLLGQYHFELAGSDVAALEDAIATRLTLRYPVVVTVVP